MNTLEKELVKVLNDAFSQNHEDQVSTKGYEDSIKDFQDFVNKGLIKPRGYNLQTIEENMFCQQNYQSNVGIVY